MARADSSKWWQERQAAHRLHTTCVFRVLRVIVFGIIVFRVNAFGFMVNVFGIIDRVNVFGMFSVNVFGIIGWG